MLMKFHSNEQNLVANILKSKRPLTLILNMCIWSNILNKYDAKEPDYSYGHISGTSGAIYLKLS